LSNYRRGLDWRLDLLTTLTHDSWLHFIIAPLPIFTLYKLLQHTLSLFSLLSLSTNRFLVTVSSSGNSSAFGLTASNKSSLQRLP
jgi:hypothetical protein